MINAIKEPSLQSVLESMRKDFFVESIEDVIKLLTIHYFYSKDIPSEFIQHLVLITTDITSLENTN